MEIIKFRPTYKTEDNLVVIDESTVPIPRGFLIKERSVVVFPSGSKGGNHKHPRRELFYTTGDLTLIYLDGNKDKISMAPENGEYKLFVINKDLPHVVVNETDKEICMFEFADDIQHGVEKVDLLINEK
jgi:hypothetical protein